MSNTLVYIILFVMGFIGFAYGITRLQDFPTSMAIVGLGVMLGTLILATTDQKKKGEQQKNEITG
jgi:predicted tellurium resistance membrane protein TerC|tara:strand:+ start:788 stop:982 length:195 start_codon:yes stop_codon:yes gene_type:complete